MRTPALIAALCFFSCSGAISAELKTTRVEPGAQVIVELVNDSLDAASWSPCDESWFIELEGGARERDPKRVYCNLGTTLHLGPNDIRLTAPERSGRFFAVLTVTQGRTPVELTVGPVDVQH